MARIRRPEKYDEGLILAIEKAGGPTALAGLLGLVPSAITQWRRVPMKWVFEISSKTGLPLHQLRPEFPIQDAA